MAAVVFVPKETEPGETRVAATPESTKGLLKLGLAVQVERPRNSARAKEMIRSVSGAVWESMTGTPSPLTVMRHGHGARRGPSSRTVRRSPSKGRPRPS